ncbi:hypothetical protein H1C71_011496, partial [Ictidomys tridecemlineatus]|uniref:Uncharacterized protein n=1 Tax=Ictidomys tridecemlineatus TaxID=43179 RepID=A0A287DC67_ICTTR
HIQDPASLRLTRSKSPKCMLVIRKVPDASLLQPFKKLCVYLLEENNMIMYMEKKVGRLHHLSGGDGILLCASSLFQGECLWLCFLTLFNLKNFQSQVTQVIVGNAAIVLRSGLRVRVVKELRGKKRTTHNAFSENGLDTEIGKQPMQYQMLNEVMTDRGPSSYLSNMNVYLDRHLMTTVQGNAVIVSTRTSGIVYAAAAGASMIHPKVPAIMLTPICSHLPSCSPKVVPAGVELKIMVSPEARNTAWVSLDTWKPQEVCHGNSITVTASCHLLPSICVRGQVSDWFKSLAQCLHWT